MDKFLDIDEQLSAAIRTAVREHKFKSDDYKKIYSLDDMTIDYIDEDEAGGKIYQVFGDTLAEASYEISDPGDPYSNPINKDSLVNVSVELKVTVYPDNDEIDVQTVEILEGE